MVTEEGQDDQIQEKVVLKRKLTGPPRLLLGKSRSKTQGDVRSEARTNRNKRVTINNGTPTGSSLEHPNTDAEEKGSPIISLDEPHITSSRREEEAPLELLAEPSRCGSTPEDSSKRQLVGNSQIKKSAKPGWKRIFCPAVLCARRQRKERRKTSVEECDQVKTPLSNEMTEGKSLKEDVISLNDKRDASDNIMKRKGRFTVRTWPTIKRFLTSSQVHQRSKSQAGVVHERSEDIQRPSLTFRKKLQRFLIHGRRVPSPAVPLGQEDIQEPGDQEAEAQPTSSQDEGRLRCGATTQLDDLREDGKEVRGWCTGSVTVSAEVSALLSGQRDTDEIVATPEVPESPVTTTEERLVINIEDPEDSQVEVTKGTETLETESSMKTTDDLTCVTSTDSTVLNEVVDVAMDANEVHTDQRHQIQCLEKEVVETIDGAIFDVVKTVATDTNEHLCSSNQILSFEEAGEKAEGTPKKENDIITRTTEVNILQNGQTLTNIGLDGLSVLQCTFCEINNTSMVDSDTSDQYSHILGDEGFESGLPLEDDQNLVCRESRLVQTARSLVQAAMRAAIEQLSMERQGNTTNVHREVQGCRDHA